MIVALKMHAFEVSPLLLPLVLGEPRQKSRVKSADPIGLAAQHWKEEIWFCCHMFRAWANLSFEPESEQVSDCDTHQQHQEFLSEGDSSAQLIIHSLLESRWTWILYRGSPQCKWLSIFMAFFAVMLPTFLCSSHLCSRPSSDRRKTSTNQNSTPGFPLWRPNPEAYPVPVS